MLPFSDPTQSHDIPKRGAFGMPGRLSAVAVGICEKSPVPITRSLHRSNAPLHPITTREGSEHTGSVVALCVLIGSASTHYTIKRNIPEDQSFCRSAIECMVHRSRASFHFSFSPRTLGKAQFQRDLGCFISTCQQNIGLFLRYV